MNRLRCLRSTGVFIAVVVPGEDLQVKHGILRPCSCRPGCDKGINVKMTASLIFILLGLFFFCIISTKK